VPGRRETIKFAAPTSSSAVEQALEFIRSHCESRGHRVLDTNARIVAFTSEVAGDPARQPLSQRDPRIPHDAPARFGTSSAEWPARTWNLSHGGLFLATRRPLPVGCEVRIILEVQPFEIPLQGTVAWSRREHSPDRPSGIGVQLRVPPTMYTRYVRSLREAQLTESGTT
jgi:Tfp pilus assembly protein PilZ